MPGTFKGLMARAPSLGLLQREGNGEDTTAPAVPTDLTVVGVTETTVSLTWTPPADNVLVTGYHVYRDAVLIDTTADPHYTDSGRALDTTYAYQVDAFDAMGNTSAPCGAVNAKTLWSVLPGPRMGINVWAQDYKSKAQIDALIGWANGKLSDLYLFAIDDSISPKTWMGSATLSNDSAVVIEGKTPWRYLYDLAHAARIRVHAWIWLSHFHYWGGTAGIDQTIPNNATYNDNSEATGIWNFANATARTAMVARIADFVANNPVDGLNFNHESTTALLTEAHNTAFLTELRAAVTDPNIEFSFYTGASISDDIALKLDMDSWISTNLVDTAMLMGYYDDAETKRRYVVEGLGLPTNSPRVFAGIGAEHNTGIATDVRRDLIRNNTEGYAGMFAFCWGDNVKDDTQVQAALGEYRAGTLTAPQGAVSKVVVVPGTSWTVRVNDVDQVTNYAAVADHLWSGPLREHIEALVGPNPQVLYDRAGSVTTGIIGGDYEP